MIPITKPFFDTDEIENMKEVLNSGWVAQGPAVVQFENILKAHEGVKEAIATSSCTTALHLALQASGIGRLDDVLVPSFTFIASANAILYTGATPVFADIDINTFNISTESINKIIHENYKWDSKSEFLINRATNNKLKAILVVHQFGLCADIYSINDIAKKFGMKVIEDAACALGAKINNVSQGNFGNISCVSFHPRKCITTGEGGMIFTNDEEIAKYVRKIRSHGAEVSELNRNNFNSGTLLPEFTELGYNYRMSDLQAAVGIAQAKKLDKIISLRRKFAKRYHELLAEVEFIKSPTEPEGYFHTYQSYVCRLVSNDLTIRELGCVRNKLMEKLHECGIQTRQGTHAIHTTAFYKRNNLQNDSILETSLKADLHSIALPLFAEMSMSDLEFVVDNLKHNYLKVIRQ